VRAAARRIEGRVVRTPLRRSEWLSAAAGGEVFLKLENLQPTFSYKLRGAFNAVLALVEERGRDVPPLVTASAGNHGRALAYAAQEAGLALTVYVPEAAPRTKIDAIRRTGATMETCRDYDEAESRAKQHGATGSALFVSPYSHSYVIAGAGTIGLEILEEQPKLDTVVVQVGGGGLISGIAIAIKAISPQASVVGVEVAASSPFTQGLAAGRIVTIEVGPTLADGLAGNLDPDTITFDIVRRLVDRVVLVSEPQLEEAVAGIARHERLIAEGAGAAGAAAIVGRCLDTRARRTAVILTGANIDRDTLKKLI
jgi:threonine dehydratase